MSASPDSRLPLHLPDNFIFRLGQSFVHEFGLLYLGRWEVLSMPYPGAPSKFTMPISGPKVYTQDLLWAIWSQRMMPATIKNWVPSDSNFGAEDPLATDPEELACAADCVNCFLAQTSVC